MAKKKIKPVYCDYDKVRKYDANINIIFGGRDNGKSYGAKKLALEDFMTTGGQFAYIRRWDKEIPASKARLWAADTPVDEITNGAFNLIDCGKGYFELSMYNFETERKSNRQVCGYYFALNDATHYASTQYPNIRTIILEEFIPINGVYLANEMEVYHHVLSTIARGRPDVKVYMIANSISRQSPYWEEYGIAQLIRDIDVGQFRTVERETTNGKQKILVHYAKPNPAANASNLFAGHRATMTVEGKWLADPHPRIDDLDTWTPVYTFYVEYMEARFVCRYMVRGSEFTIYVEPFTGKHKKTDRIVSDRFSFNPFESRGFEPVNDTEAAVFNLIPARCCYSDDLTGTEFEEIFENFQISY